MLEEVGEEAVTAVGGLGAAFRVVMELDVADPLAPTAFIQVTVKLYVVAGVKPVTVIGPLPPPVAVTLIEPGDETAVQFVIADPSAEPRV